MRLVSSADSKGCSKRRCKNSADLRVQQPGAVADIHQLLLSQFAAPLCLLHHHSELFDLGLQQTCSALHHGNLLLHVILAPRGVVQVNLGILETIIWH